MVARRPDRVLLHQSVIQSGSPADALFALALQRELDPQTINAYVAKPSPTTSPPFMKRG